MWSQSGSDYRDASNPLFGEHLDSGLFRSGGISNGYTSVSSSDYETIQDHKSDQESGRNGHEFSVDWNLHYAGLVDTNNPGLYHGPNVYGDSHALDARAGSFHGNSATRFHGFSQAHMASASSNAHVVSYAGYDPSLVSAGSFAWPVGHADPRHTHVRPSSGAYHPPYYPPTLNEVHSHTCHHALETDHSASSAVGYGMNGLRESFVQEHHDNVNKISNGSGCSHPASVITKPQSSRKLQPKQDDTTKGKKKERLLKKRSQFDNRVLEEDERTVTSSGRTGDDSPAHSSSFYNDEEEFDNTEEEDESVRQDPLYNTEPGADGLYHCPYLQDEGCNHAPTKLKCNYDKYIDSHLKPHRCKQPECHELRFSSTACRLRHERETHGSHGHGLKPFLCLYSDCDRAKPGMGFPRSWNRNDHMRRVHGHNTSPTSEDKDSASAPLTTTPTVTAAPSTTRRASIVKKRMAEDTPTPHLEKRQKLASEPDTSNSAAAHRHPLRSAKEILFSQWHQQFLSVHGRYHTILGPWNLDAQEQLLRETTALYNLAKQYTQCT